MAEDDDLFRRWSRRRRSVAEEEARATEPVPEPEPEAPEEVVPETPEDERLLLERLRLPLPESLKAGDDFSIFMRAGVPEFLRRRALRMLWRSNPTLANLDGLNDYDIDYRSPEMNLKVLATAYRVGQGFLKSAQPAKIKQTDETALAAEESAEADLQSAAPALVDVPDEHPDISDEHLEIGEDAEMSFNPKRMRFNT